MSRRQRSRMTSALALLICCILSLNRALKTCFERSHELNYLFLLDGSQLQIPLLPLDCRSCSDAEQVSVISDVFLLEHISFRSTFNWSKNNLQGIELFNGWRYSWGISKLKSQPISVWSVHVPFTCNTVVIRCYSMSHPQHWRIDFYRWPTFNQQYSAPFKRALLLFHPGLLWPARSESTFTLVTIVSSLDRSKSTIAVPINSNISSINPVSDSIGHICPWNSTESLCARQITRVNTLSRTFISSITDRSGDESIIYWPRWSSCPCSILGARRGLC